MTKEKSKQNQLIKYIRQKTIAIKKMITLIGTGHVFNLGKALIDIFDEKDPDIICVELDKQRYQALTLKRQDPESYKKMEKNVPIIYKVLSRFQEGMAKEYGVTAGQEMLISIDYAKERQISAAFIDMNAQRMFRRMLKSMSFSEKFKLMFSGFGGLFVSKKKVDSELKKIENNFDRYIVEIGKKFPTIKRILIDERNNFMVQHLSAANEKYKNIIAVLGDGHIPGISKLLGDKNIEYETIRLSQLRGQKEIQKDSSTASFTIKYEEI